MSQLMGDFQNMPKKASLLISPEFSMFTYEIWRFVNYCKYKLKGLIHFSDIIYRDNHYYQRAQRLMCEVCRTEGQDYLFKNGPKKVLTTNNLYKVFKNAVAPIKLCHIHSIELFHMGERRFLKEHISFARGLAVRTKTQVEADSPFGL